MAIEVTRLSASQGKDPDIIKAWFDNNAGEYFDSSEIAEDTILLKNSGETVMSIKLTVSACTFNVYVNSSVTISRTASNSYYINRLAKTPHGVAIGFFNGSSDTPYHIFISKTSEERVGIIITSTIGSSLGNYAIESIGGSVRTISSSVTPSVMAENITTLTPCVCDGANGEYMPDCFITSFSQYKNIECTFIADGTEYLYNGFIAMR